MALVRGRPLVGRRNQFDVLEGRLAAARQGHGGVIFVAGEPGIGKTTLAGALADAAQGAGAIAIWGRCRETGGAPPYWPWVQVVRGLLDSNADLPAAGRVDPGDLLALSVPGASPSGSRFRLYEAVAALLRAAGESGGLLVVLDDIHKADEPSLALLRYLTAGLADARVLVLCCHRDTDLGPSHPLLEVLASAETTSSSLMHLPALQAAETAELVAAFCGETLGGQVAPAVAARSGGNPLFVVEIARLVQAGGVAAAASMPATVREVIRARLAGVPPETAHALVAAAVLGRLFVVRVLAAVLETSELATVAALQPAATVHLITPDPDGRSTYRFAHAVVQETLYEQLPVERRTSLHARAADMLGAGGDPDDDVVSEIAFHRYHAALAGDVTEAVTATLSAGRRAASRLAYEEADRWLTLSLELAGRATGVDRLALLLEAGDVGVRGGHRSKARAHFEAAAALARSASDTRALARAALGAGATVVTAGTVDWPLVRLLEEAAARMQEDLTLRTQLLSRRAVELYWQRGAESVGLSAEALEVAERSGDDRAVGVALHARQFTLRGPDHLTERVQIGERLVGLAGRVGDLDLEFEAHTWLAADVLRTGDIGRFLSELNALEGVSERSREPLHRWYAQVYSAELAGLRGRPTEASQIADDAAELGDRLQVPVARAYRIAQRAVSGRDLGTFAELERDVRQAIEQYRYFPTLRAVLALLLAEAGRKPEARAEIDHLAAGQFAALPRDALWTTTIALLGEAAAMVESVHTDQLATLLEPHAGEILVHGIPACWGAVDRVRGVLASAAERWTEADAAFSAALATHRRIGAPGWEARTTLDRARALLRRDERGAAAVSAREASDQAAALGLEGIKAPAEMVLAAAAAGGPQPRLSRRELQVLALLTSGASNKEIASTLVVSIHTVERHLANIYAKLGARSRSDASAFAVRHGLV